MRLTPQLKKHINKLLPLIANGQYSIREILEKMGLHDRKHLVQSYIQPAFNNGYIQWLFSNQPNHPRQKYLLTEKGLALASELKGE